MTATRLIAGLTSLIVAAAVLHAQEKPPAAERKLRRDLEKYHNGKPDPQAIANAWPHLASKDRWLQFAARLAIENQPAGQCIKCHRMGEIGGGAGPDLTAVASRFSRRDILESILEPSKVISEQYRNVSIITLAGKTVTGRLVDETPGKIVLQPDPLSGERVEIAVKDIDARSVSKISPMPANLVDVPTADEILDLIAYLEASGQRQHAVFSKK